MLSGVEFQLEDVQLLQLLLLPLLLLLLLLHLRWKLLAIENGFKGIVPTTTGMVKHKLNPRRTLIEIYKTKKRFSKYINEYLFKTYCVWRIPKYYRSFCKIKIK